MHLNEHVALSTSKISLIPYCQHHVATYHDWMKDPDIQAATASEPLTLEDEYAMQKSWRQDGDKLTFIICLPIASASTPNDHAAEIASMLGDVNMFICLHEEDDGKVSLVGEIELMIATRDFQRKGHGREALLCFLQYIAAHESEILKQFRHANAQDIPQGFDYLAGKIGESNEGSLHLFNSLGFEKTTSTPNFFGEFELRRATISSESIRGLADKYGVTEYQERRYSSPTNPLITAVNT